MSHPVLDKFVSLGLIVGYELDDVDEEGNVGKTSECRNTERLTLHFSDGNKVVIDTFCTGSSENTVLEISE